MSPRTMILQAQEVISSHFAGWPADLRLTAVSAFKWQFGSDDDKADRSLPASLHRQAAAVRRMRTVTIWMIPLLMVAVSNHLINGHFPSGLRQATGTLAVGCMLAVGIWRMTLASAVRLAAQVNAWAQETNQDPDIWPEQPLDASAIWSRYIPASSRVRLPLLVRRP